MSLRFMRLAVTFVAVPGLFFLLGYVVRTHI
jgi:hypothetical protein